MGDHMYSKLQNLMFLVLYQSIIIGGLLLTLVTYKASQVYYKDEKLPVPSRVISAVEINQYSAIVHHSRPMLKAYLDSLSSTQAKHVIRQIGVGNLTSQMSQRQFLSCSGMAILGSSVKSSIQVPPSHQYCKKMSFRRSGPVVALGSFPGSGNSWVRQLLESATGIYTGAMYCDGSYIGAGMIGEGITTANVIAIKTHDWPYAAKHHLNHDRAIYIVRSPFGSILSEHNRFLASFYKKKLQLGDRHTSEVHQEYYSFANDSGWEPKVKRASSKWKRIVRQWLSVKDFPVLIVGYENLMNNTYAELKRMLDFIGHPYTEDSVMCTVKNSGEVFHRKHTKKQENPYSPELQEFVLNQIKEIDTSLQEHNISLHHPYTV